MVEEERQSPLPEEGVGGAPQPSRQVPKGSVAETEGTHPEPQSTEPDRPTRKSLQLGRRGFHMFNGTAAASAYAALFSHQQAVYLLGTIACLVYLFDQIRINYPEIQRQFPWAERVFLRAEEQFKESAMIPYAIAILLTIITFPKVVALIAIYTLALADPISAIVGIRFGTHRVVPEKTIEGSLAFFTVTLFVGMLVFFRGTEATFWPIFGASFIIALLASIFESLPIKLDDNLTIPIFVGFVGWMCAALFNLPV